MEDVKIKFLLAILKQLPFHSQMYVGDYLNSAFNDGYFSKLKDYFLDIGIYKKQYDYCINMSIECIFYMEQEFVNDDSLINYFCHYAIKFKDKILLKVYDGCIFSIDQSLNIPIGLIDECENNELIIYQEEDIDF